MSFAPTVPEGHPLAQLPGVIVKPRKVDFERLEALGRELLLAIGENPDEDRIKDTPRRFAKWWREFIQRDPGTLSTSFEQHQQDQMVVVSGMKVWSLCEHHLLPFWAEVSIGYIPNGRVLGLSKFARIAHHCASRLQIQERLVREIAQTVMELTGSEDVAVIAQGEHLCMTMRGIKTQALMTSSVVEGRFKRPEVRAEFLSLTARGR